MYTSARDLFESAYDASEDAERCYNQLMELRHRAMSLGSQGAEARVRSTSDPGRMAARVGAYVDLERSLDLRMEEDYATIEMANRVLFGEDYQSGLLVLVPKWWVDVLNWRYLMNCKWKFVAHKVHRSERRCRDVAAAAFDVIDGIGIEAVAHGLGTAED